MKSYRLNERATSFLQSFGNKKLTILRISIINNKSTLNHKITGGIKITGLSLSARCVMNLKVLFGPDLKGNHLMNPKMANPFGATVFDDDTVCEDASWRGAWNRPVEIDPKTEHPLTIARMTNHNVRGCDELYEDLQAEGMDC